MPGFSQAKKYTDPDIHHEISREKYGIAAIVDYKFYKISAAFSVGLG